MKRELIDGVPVLWVETPGPLEATLVFGCGVRDETFRTLGVTHLIEHLAMSTLPRLHFDHNASVDLALTQFTCTGRPEQVTDFLERVCRALTVLPLERIEKEAGVLEAEGSGVADPTTAELLSIRYGTEGVGLASFGGPGPDRIPVEAVQDTVARYFHAQNAALVLTGPPPAGLRLPLPSGERPARATEQTVRQTGPSWQQAQVPGPGLSLSCDLNDQAVFVAVQLLRQRLTETVRHREGLTYDVGGDAVFVAPGRGERTICMEAREGQEQRVCELLWQEALRLATEEVPQAELAEEVEASREVLLDPRAVEYELVEAAAEHLLADAPMGNRARLDVIEELTPARVREAFATALGSALLVVPCEVEVRAHWADGTELRQYSCGEGGELPSKGQEFRPPLTARLRYSGARKVRLMVTGDGLWMRQPDGSVHAIAFTDVVGVEMQGPGRVVYGTGNCFLPVLPDLFAGIGPAVAAIDAAVPAELRYPASAFRSAD
ncbi:insulinase family protein [Kitasatospora sp. NPDC059327]|uniref:insulinase family protein n=1 Tax=Kitasatospora sp. NPDC059327 TaxID=3346803 RepID=UPI0036906CC2